MVTRVRSMSAGAGITGGSGGGVRYRPPVTQAKPVGEPRTRRDRRDPYSVDALLEAVVPVFIERGYDATSMDDLARAIGRSKASIYHHVPSKEHLLRLAVARAVDALFEVLEEDASTTGPAVQRLEHVVRRSVRVLVEHLPYVTLLLRVRGNTETERWALERRRTFDRRLSALVADAIEEGDVRRDLDALVVARVLFGMVNSVTEWYRPGGRHGLDQVEAALVALAFEGLR
jgi:AcrR family transcriptional regulator